MSTGTLLPVPVPDLLALDVPFDLRTLFRDVPRSAELDHLLMEWLTATLATEGGRDALLELIRARDAGALFAVSTSGGKDSQAQALLLSQIVPGHQRVDIHASLGDLEWPGALELAQDTARNAGVAFQVVKAKKSLTTMVEERFQTRPGVPSFPSSLARYCTQSQKTTVCDAFIRKYADQNQFTIIVSCLGMRADESHARAKKPIWKPHDADGAKGRRWSIFLPIHATPQTWVFAFIAANGEVPHPAYAAGNKRLSCLCCIFAAKSDLLHAARAHPEIVNRYIRLEDHTGYSMHQNRKTLRQLTDLEPGAFHPEPGQPLTPGPRLSGERQLSELRAVPLGKAG